MKKPTPLAGRAALVAVLAGLSLSPLAQANPCAPRAAANPCAAKKTNPCAAKNPCAAQAPSAAALTRPADYRPYQAPQEELIAAGKKLWQDPSIGKSGLSCQSCHQGGGAFQASFAQPYPHPVGMASDRFKMKQVHLDEMVQLCMAVPMATQPLPWNSKELAALTAYAGEVQKDYQKSLAGNPCAAKPVNPCAAKAANPCAANNPCAAKANPCAARR